jgi:SPX domain protein involved in polyphosphate accumulation
MGAPLQVAFTRRERKFPRPAGEWDRVIAAVAARLPVERFDGVHDLVNIRTVYLDTPPLDVYREYRERRPVRTKLRIRQYGFDGRFGDECWVEIKSKRRFETLKRRFRCDSDTVLALMAGQDVRERVAALNDRRPDALAVHRAARRMILNRGLGPVVRVDYQRVSFQQPGAPGARVTVDRGVAFRGAANPRTERLDGIVLEVKHAAAPPSWLPRFLEGLGIAGAGRFSKYARAVEALGLPERMQRDSA